MSTKLIQTATAQRQRKHRAKRSAAGYRSTVRHPASRHQRNDLYGLFIFNHFFNGGIGGGINQKSILSC
ncbi:hypothetical protein [Propionivibrio sp.]|uniref:hypothetical protein n=1 Tax=Propionivibrio sp. TaxID=2212460 RepID=UPI003BF31CF9